MPLLKMYLEFKAEKSHPIGLQILGAEIKHIELERPSPNGFDFCSMVEISIRTRGSH